MSSRLAAPPATLPADLRPVDLRPLNLRPLNLRSALSHVQLVCCLTPHGRVPVLSAGRRRSNLPGNSQAQGPCGGGNSGERVSRTPA